MDLSSLTFLFIFFPVFFVLYLISRPSLRLALVSAANVAFILAGQPWALFPLLGIALVGYIAGRLLESNKQRPGIASLWMWLGIGINLGILAVAKFAGAYGRDFLSIGAVHLGGIVSLLGLSYITFQVISYLVDISKGTIPAEKDVIKFAAYILFFPKLISGPITRYKQFRDQLPALDPPVEEIAGGFRRVLIGVIKRILIASQLGIFANAVFDLPTPNVEPHIAWLALLAYSLQIYFDFSGYTDVALGLGRMIGITLPENFNDPYTAQSISDFWRRWHITLSTWFREYVFYPLERRKLRFAGQQINLILVFLLTGLWHGPTLTFIAWGLLHGLAIAFESAGGARWMKNLWRPLRHLYALSIIILGWVFFRSSNLDFAFGFIGRLFGNRAGITPMPFSQTSPLPFVEPSFVLITIVALIFSLPIASLWTTARKRFETANPLHILPLQLAEDLVVLAIFVLSVAAHVSGTFLPNIYAKF
jgi:alginate O-acetyltransferase complex protein AlgI